jgi:hypothetical protein
MTLRGSGNHPLEVLFGFASSLDTLAAAIPPFLPFMSLVGHSPGRTTGRVDYLDFDTFSSSCTTT